MLMLGLRLIHKTHPRAKNGKLRAKALNTLAPTLLMLAFDCSNNKDAKDLPGRLLDEQATTPTLLMTGAISGAD